MAPAMMEALRSRNRWSRGVALALIVVAMLARLIVPQGWMATPGAGGWQITLCSGTGPVAIPAPLAEAVKSLHRGSAPSDPGAADHPCAFASLAMALDAPPPVAIDLPRPVIATWPAALALSVTIGRGLAAPPPPSTGPPSV